jgi:TetR/AcrR family transcriptional regulator, cholesterol catabolism regulator
VETTRARESMGRRERKKLEVAQRIRSAALELFREQGYEATTVEEIAERADVAKGTFFNHFARKDALLEDLAEEVFSALLEDLGPVAEWRGTARDGLLRLFLRLCEVISGDPELSKIMLIENMRNYWMRAGPDPVEEAFARTVTEALTQAVERGEIAANADVARAGKLLEAAHVTTMIEWLKAGVPEGVYERELTVKVDIIFRGLAREPAAKGQGS